MKADTLDGQATSTPWLSVRSLQQEDKEHLKHLGDVSSYLLK